MGNGVFPQMGISGAGLASTIAEGIAFIVFVIYIYFDRENRQYGICQIPKIQRRTTLALDHSEGNQRSNLSYCFKASTVSPSPPLI